MLLLQLLAGAGLANTETHEIVTGTWTTEGLWLASQLDRTFTATIELAVVRDGEQVASEAELVLFGGASTQLLVPRWPDLPDGWDTVGVPLTVTASVATYDEAGERFHEPMMLDLAYVAVRGGRVVALLPELTDAPEVRALQARLAEDEELATVSATALQGGR